MPSLQVSTTVWKMTVDEDCQAVSLHFASNFAEQMIVELFMADVFLSVTELLATATDMDCLGYRTCSRIVEHYCVHLIIAVPSVLSVSLSWKGRAQPQLTL